MDKYKDDIYETDKNLTIKNKGKLEKNKNLLYWYKKLYLHQFEKIDQIEQKKILEIGSGTSPLKTFYPYVLTSDVLKLDYLDFCFDAHAIDTFDEIQDESLDIITLTNVLHHLKKPISFLLNAQKKLKPGGKIIFTEPYFSHIAYFIYTQIHHEPVDFKIKTPELSETLGPLSSANIALPYLIFYSRSNWEGVLSNTYSYDSSKVKFFSSLSYMCTGGISRKIPLPVFLYKPLFQADNFLAKIFPKFFASFFTLTLTKKT